MEQRRLLANLSATDAYVGFAWPYEDLIEGQYIGVSVIYDAIDLPDTEYAIEYSVNGLKAEPPNITDGRDGADGEYRNGISRWYAQPGVNTVEIRLDSNIQIAKTDESDNVIRFEFDRAFENDPFFDLELVGDWV